MNNLILIDFDGTITSRDTTKVLLIQLLLLRPWRIFRTAWFLFKMIYSNDSNNKQDYKNGAIGHLITGLTDYDMMHVLQQFSNKVKTLYRSSMINKISKSIENGTSVLIVTASPSFVIRCCVSHLSVEVIGTEFQKNDSVYCGQLNGKACFGIEKVNKINLWLKDSDLDWSITEAWSDDFSDYHMLKMAKQRYWIGGSVLQKIVNDKDPSGNFILNKS